MPIPTSITTRLEYQHKSLLDIIEGLSDEEIRRQVIAGKWSIFENIVHLATYQHAFLDRMRKILDEEIPDDLAIEMCSKSQIKFWFYPQMTPPRLSSYKFRDTFPVDELSTKEAFIKFGGQNIEEALEKSYTEIGDN